ncbi:hypothetical protein KR018_000703 [Drosophila ironensis]|nr:hypothetical protein KR018_000703 [Drosophila ironensis]
MSRLLSTISSSMLLLLLLVCLGSASAKPHEELTKDHATELAKECMAETGATDEDVKELMLHHEKPERHEAKCLRACVMKKFEIMDESGKLNKEHAEEMIKALSDHEAAKEEVVAEVADKCVALEVPEDHCDAAVAYEACIFEHMKEHGLELKDS